MIVFNILRRPSYCEIALARVYSCDRSNHESNWRRNDCTTSQTQTIVSTFGRGEILPNWSRSAPFRIVRPSPQAVWRPARDKAEWQQVDASYERFTGGDGKWSFRNPAFKQGTVANVDGLQFVLKPTDFGHLGIFAEQRSTWTFLQTLIKAQGRSDIKVLNLFAYTGGATLACANAGAEVVHIDASKTSVAWARENAQASGLADKPIRWIVEDVKKFVQREVKRGSRYQGIILDPPSFGRGNKGETWKIETDLLELLDDLKQIFAEDGIFIALSSHSPGYTPLAKQNILQQIFASQGFKFWNQEMVIAMQGSSLVLPSGAISIMYRS